MRGNGVDVVRERVQGLAKRGVFNGWAEATQRGKTVFRFRWLLGAEFQLIVDPKKHEIIVRDVLPGIEHRSFIDTDLRAFVAGRNDRALPPHRRLDKRLGSLAYVNRQQRVSLIMRIRPRGYEPGIKSLFTILNDLFAHLHMHHIDYLHKNFGVPEE